MSGRPPFLLVHGGMHGAWCWQRVVPLLECTGHRVVTVTLTGLGERVHLGGPEVDLSLHIKDVLACVETEELEEFILVGHSYGGMVITGVADLIPRLIRDVVYLDALVPQDGQSGVELTGGRGIDLSAIPGGMLPPMADYDFGLTAPEDIAWVRRRVTAQSVRTITEPLYLMSDHSKLRRHFIECVCERQDNPQMKAIAGIAERIRKDPAWSHYVLASGHDCMISHPQDTADMLLRIARD